MTVENLSNYVAPNGTITFEGFEKIRLNDYHVCELLQGYVLAAISWVEQTDRLVKKVALTPESIRAFPEDASEGTVQPEFIEVKLPKGVYERAVDLSAGPLSPFPTPTPSEEVKLFLGRLQQAAFPEVPGLTRPFMAKDKGYKIPRHIILNTNNFSDVRRWLHSRFDPCTTRDELMTGFQGILWETETSMNVQSGQGAPENPEPQGRSVKVWLSRLVSIGTVWTSGNQPPPNWDPQKVQVYNLTDPNGSPV